MRRLEGGRIRNTELRSERKGSKDIWRSLWLSSRVKGYFFHNQRDGLSVMPSEGLHEPKEYVLGKGNLDEFNARQFLCFKEFIALRVDDCMMFC
jgi:hypothetical protein